MGEGKAKKYGQPFIELIAKYVEENEIERPQDLIVKSTASKSAVKIQIIGMIDRRLPFDDIAKGLDMPMCDLLTEVETIVSAGTRLNINYYVNQEVEPDVVAELMDYFRHEAASDSLDDAIRALENDYSEMEIRLTRIKFICEVAS